MKNLQDVFAAPTFQINIFVQLFQLIIRFCSLCSIMRFPLLFFVLLLLIMISRGNLGIAPQGGITALSHSTTPRRVPSHPMTIIISIILFLDGAQQLHTNLLVIFISAYFFLSTLYFSTGHRHMWLTGCFD